MRISGTFLSSAIARRIALILFLAAFIPTALVTELTHQTIGKLVKDNSHRKLVDTSHNYALSTFSNLTSARTNLLQVASLIDSSNLTLQDKLTELNNYTFSSLLLITPKGRVLDQSGRAQYYSKALFKNTIKAIIEDSAPDTVKLLVLPPAHNNEEPVIALALPRIKRGNSKALLIAEINPNYLWGDKSDYPSDISVCAYRIDRDTKTRLFCSGPENPAFKNASTPGYTGTWELFLRAKFQDNSWAFVSKNQYPIAVSNTDSFISSYSFIGIALISLLLVGLLSLIQIRRTMVPLERLINGARNISKGDFTPVEVDGQNEFGELADAFNGMSAHIERQLNTLRSLSVIDREIVTKLDVDYLIRLIISRIEQIMPTAIICVTRLNENAGSEAQCSITVSDNATLASPRIAISREEINVIETYGLGRFGHCRKDSRLIHENLLAELGAIYFWILPIFWQGEMCAFLSIGNEESLHADDPSWDEIRELAGRIGIAISAQEREDQLLVQAQYDNLTGLPNRILLQDRLRQAIEYSDRSGDPFWVAFLDLDRFKFINDTLGHKTGDLLLSEISRRLEQAIRDTDTVARFGGDEFIIILQGHMDENFRMGLLYRLVRAVETPTIIEGKNVALTCSIGISTYPTDGSTPDTLLRNADIAMYRAKELGRNNFQFFTQSMNEKVAAQLHMEVHLRQALELNEFLVFYQPKIDLSTKQIVGMEALVRWNSKELGLMLPQHFIPLAEETGLIVPIAEWVLKTACTQAASWHKAGFEKLLMSVNISARQFGQKNLVGSIANILKETGLKAEYLELELTESLLMNEVEGSLRTLHEIKSLGVHLSVDDFGTGYSSLSYLRNLPLNTLKIDKSFIDDIVMHTDEAPIVASIISLAKNLKLKVVAEGVESHEQVTYLESHGCNEIQGYYFCQPEAAESIEAMLKMGKMPS